MARVIYTPGFKRAYDSLSQKTRDRAKKRLTVLRGNLFDGKFKTHKLSGKLKGLYAFSVDHKYRIIFEFLGNEDIALHDVGGHDIYR